MLKNYRVLPVMALLAFLGLSLYQPVTATAEETAINTNTAVQDVQWNKKQRPAVLKSESEEGVFTLGNVRWGFDEKGSHIDTSEPKWRQDVKVDINKVSDVYFVIKPFPPEWLAAHCLFIFEFDNSGYITTENKETSKGLILSIEARLRIDQSYSLVQGQFDKFKIIYQLGCYEDYIQVCSLENKRLIPIKLKLTHEQKADLLENAIRASLKNRDNEMYNTLQNNCTNNLFLLLNTVLPDEQQFKEWLLKKFLYNTSISFPRTAGIVLKKHGVVEEKMPVIMPNNLNKADIATRRLEGETLAAAQKKAEKISRRADSVKTIIKDGLAEGYISKDLLKTLMYNEIAESVFRLHVPGTVTGEDNNGEFTIGSEFAEKIDRAASVSDLTNYIDECFESYKNAVSNRMTFEGNDISNYLDANLSELGKTFSQAAKYSEINQRN